MEERLQKFLSRAGMASRRHAEEMIVEGRVKVNGKVVTVLGTRIEPQKDLVLLDGKLVSVNTERKYFLFYKPPGVVTTMSDPEGRPTVADYAVDTGGRVFPVGRLDYDAEGALLLTDDGDLANKLMHPSHQVPRVYLAKVKGVPDEPSLQKLVEGVRLEDGMAHAVEARIFEKAQRNTWVKIVVTEGRQHLVKRLCAAIGHPVVRLYRPAHAGLPVQGLMPGALRALTHDEVRRVKAAADGDAQPEPKLSLPARRHGHAAPGFEPEETPETTRSEGRRLEAPTAPARREQKKEREEEPPLAAPPQLPEEEAGGEWAPRSRRRSTRGVALEASSSPAPRESASPQKPSPAGAKRFGGDRPTGGRRFAGDERPARSATPGGKRFGRDEGSASGKRPRDGDSRAGSGKSFGGRSSAERPARFGGDRTERPSGESRFGGDRKRSDSASGDSRFGDRMGAGKRSGGSRAGESAFGERSGGKRPGGDRKRSDSPGDARFGERSGAGKRFGGSRDGGSAFGERSGGKRFGGDRKRSDASPGDSRSSEKSGGGKRFGAPAFGERSGGKRFGDDRKRRDASPPDSRFGARTGAGKRFGGATFGERSGGKRFEGRDGGQPERSEPAERPFGKNQRSTSGGRLGPEAGAGKKFGGRPPAGGKRFGGEGGRPGKRAGGAGQRPIKRSARPGGFKGGGRNSPKKPRGS